MPKTTSIQHFILLSLFAFCACHLQAQNIEDIGKEKPIKISGSASSGISFYHSNGISQRYDPFVWTTSAQFNLNLFGIDLPFSFMYSTQNTVLRQPFNRFGITPQYKWIKAHLGYSSMEFSPLTFSGNSMLGIGVEMNPNKLRFAAIYGRLRNSVESNFSSSFYTPSFKRLGYGVKIGYGDEKGFLDLILFRSFDKPNDEIPLDSLDIKPQDNLVVGINGQLYVTKRLSVRMESSISAINRDRYASDTELDNQKIYNSLGALFNPTITSEFYNALQGGINYSFDYFDIDIRYERIDPGYETLSTYFFNNDREELSVNAGFKLFKNKLLVRTGIGQEKNNLDESESTSMKRIAGNAQVNWMLSNNFNFSLFYTSFSSTVEYLVDELINEFPNYLQVSDTYGINAMYTLRKKSKTHSISFNGTYQGQQVDSDTEADNLNNSALYQINSRYQISISPAKLRLNAGFNFNENRISTGNNKRYGLVLGGSKSLNKNKVLLNISSGGYQTYTNEVKANFTSNSKLSAQYRWNSHHSVLPSVSFISRKANSNDGNSRSFNEYRAQINYKYQF